LAQTALWPRRFSREGQHLKRLETSHGLFAFSTWWIGRAQLSMDFIDDLTVFFQRETVYG